MRHLIPSVLLILFGSVFCSDTFSGETQRFSFKGIGYGGGGRFTACAIDPQNEKTVLVGSDVAGIYKSTDGGNLFELKGRGLEGFAVAGILFDPDNTRTVYILTNDGLYCSTDYAESWKKVSSAVRYDDRFFGSSPMLFFDKRLWAASARNGIFRVNCTIQPPVVEPVPGLLGVRISGLTVFQNLLYAGTSRGIYRFNNGFWQPVNTGLPFGRINIVDIASQKDQCLYAVEKTSGLYIWNEDEGRWEQHDPNARIMLDPGPQAYKALAIHPGNPDIIYLATHPESWPFVLFRTNNRGSTWDIAQNFSFSARSPINWRKPPDAIESLAFSSQNPSCLFMTDWLNLWRSADGGEHWSQVDNGLQNTVVHDIKIHPIKPETIFTSAADIGLTLSEDGGANWRRIMQGVEDGDAVELEISRTNPATMYLLAIPWLKKGRVYVYKSYDAGATWEDIGFAVKEIKLLQKFDFADGLPTNIELDPVDDKIAYVATNGYGIFKTSDGGATWKEINTGLLSRCVQGPDALLVHPARPQTLFVSTQNGGVFKTTDGGERWHRTCAGNYFTFGMAFDPSNAERIIAACAEKKIIISENGGTTWKQVQLPGAAPSHIAAYAVAFSPDYPETVCVGTLAYDLKAADGIFISRDRGATFDRIPVDIPLVNVRDIVFAPSGRLFAAFSGIGLYCMETGTVRHENRHLQ